MRDLTCPAATLLERPLAPVPSVVCGVLNKSNDGAHVRGFTQRGQVSPVISGEHDPNVIVAYCAGDGVPGAINCYTSCPVWRAAKEAHWADRHGPNALRDDESPRAPDVSEELRELIHGGV